MLHSPIRWLALTLLCALPAAALAQSQSAEPWSYPDAFSPIALDIAARVEHVVMLSEADSQRIARILLKCDEENGPADRECWQRWFAQMTVPSPKEVADEHAALARDARAVEDKYLEVIAQQVLNDEQRRALDAERLAARALALTNATEAQTTQAVAIAAEVVAQIAGPADRSALFARRLTALQERIDREVLTPEQRAASARGERRPQAPTTAPALPAGPAATAPATNPARPRLKYLSNHSVASDPAGVKLSLARLAEMEPLLAPAPPAILAEASRTRWVESLTEHLQYGDTRAAVVVNASPLLVAAYSDDLDAVVILRLPQWLVKEHRLTVGSRLAAVNTFPRLPLGTDLVRGPGALHQWNNVCPIIADFVTDDQDRVRQLKAAISEKEWSRCLALGQAYRKRFPSLIRNGSPLHAQEPGN